DPTLPSGRRQTITLKDLTALDLFGYRIRPVGNSRPAINSLKADLNGERLMLSGTSTDADGDILQVQLKLIDGKGVAIAETVPFAADFGIPEKLQFAIPFANMDLFPSAVKAGLTLIDSRGNKSETVIADFSKADEGGPKLKNASFKADKLTAKVKQMKGDVQVEINGLIVAPPASFEVKGKKLTMRGQAEHLNLRMGANRIRVICNGLRSNLFVMEL
ncbi:MAG TPA: hypothetical protein VNO14_12130, partial [Blastocatellia bacterium]|nr:hypothetical protein [Blastocatellia bacterium]